MSESWPPATEVPAMESSPNKGHFARFAAWISLFSPFVVAVIYLCLFVYLMSHGRTRLETIAVIGMIPLLLILVGLVLGIIALVQTGRYGRKGIFGKALTGVCLNSLFLISISVGPVLYAYIATKNLPRTRQARLDAANKKLAKAVTGEERFYALDDVAKESFEAGKIDDARRYAEELLKLAPSYKSNWNYGNAIQDGNLVLGRIAVREGRIEDAKQYLLAAGKSRGSPQMDSFGPNMSLAKDLLKKGERATVLQYFELCRRFWKMDYGKLDEWSREVKAGKIPDFGANLVY